MKNLIGDHGVTVAVLDIEGGPPDALTVGSGETELNGHIRVRAEKAIHLLSHSYTLTAIYEPDDDYRQTIVEELAHELNFEFSAGRQDDISFNIGPFSLAEAMSDLGLQTNDLVDNPHVRIELKFDVDVKGTPVDPSTTIRLKTSA